MWPKLLRLRDKLLHLGLRLWLMRLRLQVRLLELRLRLRLRLRLLLLLLCAGLRALLQELRLMLERHGLLLKGLQLLGGRLL